MSEATVKPKKKFVMPHLMLMVLFMLLLMSALTYIIPAGQFAADPETGALLGDQFSYLGYQTPVSPWAALKKIYNGVINIGYMVSIMLPMGGMAAIALKTQAIDKMLDYAIFKLKDKGFTILVIGVCLVFGFYGIVSGGDYIVAMVPIGLAIAKKLRVDPVCGFAFIIVCIMLGWTSSPTQGYMTQLMMGVPAYSGFGLRAIIAVFVLIFVTLFIFNYARKVRKDPANSILGKSEWYDELDSGDADFAKEDVKLDVRALLITLLYFGMPVTSVIMLSVLKMSMDVMPALAFIFSYAMGICAGYKLNETSQIFAGGVASMAFIVLIIGMANAMSLVMTEGNIMHTIVHAICIPLANLSTGVAAIGISIAVTLINLVIPSASAKMALLVPIITPICATLAIPMNVGAIAFKYGDAITNIVSPFLGLTMGGLEIAKVPYDKYLRWIMPLIIFLLIFCWGTLYFMGVTGWTGL